MLVLDLGPGETCDVPALHGYDGPLGVVMGKQGGLVGSGVERALTVTLPMPSTAERRQHWLHGLADGQKGAAAGRTWQVNGQIAVVAAHQRQWDGPSRAVAYFSRDVDSTPDERIGVSGHCAEWRAGRRRGRRGAASRAFSHDRRQHPPRGPPGPILCRTGRPARDQPGRRAAGGARAQPPGSRRVGRAHAGAGRRRARR